MRTLILLCFVAGLTACAGRVPDISVDATKYDVQIERDRWGIPHIHGRTDADTAFGFAYAQAEDGFPRVTSDSIIFLF